MIDPSSNYARLVIQNGQWVKDKELSTTSKAFDTNNALYSNGSVYTIEDSNQKGTVMAYNLTAGGTWFVSESFEYGDGNLGDTIALT